MKQERGASLIEIIGVLAIGGVLMAGVIATYNGVRARHTRTAAVAQMEQIAKNTKMLFDNRHNYNGVSVDYLIKAGALKNNIAPIGGQDWTITSNVAGSEFLINLTGLTKGECDYFTTVKLEWADRIKVNGYESDPGTYCLGVGGNEVSFIVK